jgi:hypothetical protein
MSWGDNPGSRISSAIKDRKIISFLKLIGNFDLPFAGVWFDACSTAEKMEKDIEQTVQTINFTHGSIFGLTFVSRGTKLWGEKLRVALFNYLADLFKNRKCPVQGKIYYFEELRNFSYKGAATYFYRIYMKDGFHKPGEIRYLFPTVLSLSNVEIKKKFSVRPLIKKKKEKIVIKRKETRLVIKKKIKIFGCHNEEARYKPILTKEEMKEEVRKRLLDVERQMNK